MVLWRRILHEGVKEVSVSIKGEYYREGKEFGSVYRTRGDHRRGLYRAYIDRGGL